jgi:hypothetical protein
MHETKDCTLGVGKTKNNCFGIRRGGKFETYANKEESYEDFKRVWQKYYGGMPNYQKARKYSGNDRTQNWINNVNNVYYKKINEKIKKKPEVYPENSRAKDFEENENKIKKLQKFK